MDRSGENNAVVDAQPSSRRLLRSTLIAAAVAALLLITAVLPAEYGVDPTGVGRLLGLTQMGEIKVALAKEAAAADAADTAARAAGTQAGSTDPRPASITPPAPQAALPAAGRARSDVTEVSLDPGQGKEIKLVMREGAQVTYSWSTTSGVVNFDKHADSTNPPRSYFGYEKGTGVAKDQGVLIAAFDGSHGWFWRNRTRSPVTLTLRTSGDYLELKWIE